MAAAVLIRFLGSPPPLQRRRSAEDELAMRDYLQEGDLISVSLLLIWGWELEQGEACQPCGAVWLLQCRETFPLV